MKAIKKILDLHFKIKNINLQIEDNSKELSEKESLKGELAALKKDFDSLAEEQFDKYMEFARSNETFFKDWDIPYLKSFYIESFEFVDSYILVKAFNTSNNKKTQFQVRVPLNFIYDKDTYLEIELGYIRKEALKEHEEKLEELRKQESLIISQIDTVRYEIDNFNSFFKDNIDKYRKNLFSI